MEGDVIAIIVYTLTFLDQHEPLSSAEYEPGAGNTQSLQVDQEFVRGPLEAPPTRSRTRVKFFMPQSKSGHDDDEDLAVKLPTLQDFLDEEEQLVKRAIEVGADAPKPKPFSRLKLEVESVEDFAKSQLHDFLARYGRQVKHLRIERRKVKYTQSELKLYRQLPNLKHLKVRGQVSLDAALEASQLPIPQVFSKLKGLDVTRIFWNPSGWRLLETCTEIETFRCDHYAASLEQIVSLVTVLCQNYHKKL